MFEPEDIFEPILEEVRRLLVEMKKTKDLEQRRLQSETLRNLCQSLGVFLDAMTTMLAEGASEFMEEDDFFDDSDDDAESF